MLDTNWTAPGQGATVYELMQATEAGSANILPVHVCEIRTALQIRTGVARLDKSYDCERAAVAIREALRIIETN